MLSLKLDTMLYLQKKRNNEIRYAYTQVPYKFELITSFIMFYIFPFIGKYSLFMKIYDVFVRDKAL